MTRALLLIGLAFSCSLRGAPLENSQLQRYFEAKAREISGECLKDVRSREQWENLRPKFREQLFEMLSLSPMPEKGDLKATITGTVERKDFVVEKLHFQSLPGLYVTGNLYRPKKVTQPLPTILYLCGHGQVKTNGVSYGNKVAYQHHGAWFARNGYVCLLIDTIQLGELEGIHHGTHREGMWWWNSRGYTPAGVEAWNCIRALDYLETRPEVDKTRFGATGRSGGGAYSWWITALDERIKVAAPVAGITDLQNHVVDGVVEGHCDCMFFVNTYRWDYPIVAALTAPRPLLLCNSDKDSIFPLDGVLRTHEKTKRIYELYGATTKLGLLITEGPHKDTQDLQVPVFRWFNRHLKGEDPIIEMAATRFFTPAELKVFNQAPQDERTTRIHETFVARTPIQDPWKLRAKLRAETFAAWPSPRTINGYNEAMQKSRDGLEVRSIEFDSEENLPLKLFYLPVPDARRINLNVITEDEIPVLNSFLHNEFGIAVDGQKEVESEQMADLFRQSISSDRQTMTAFLVVRGNGATDPRKAIQVRRRYMLLGATLDGMRVWDIGQGVELIRSWPRMSHAPLHIFASGQNAANSLVYAVMAERKPQALTLLNMPEAEKEQPDYLNLARFTSLRHLRERLRAGEFGQSVRVD